MSHRNRPHESHARPPTAVRTTVSRTRKLSRSDNQDHSAKQTNSALSPITPSRRFDATETESAAKSVNVRPSALPGSTATITGTRVGAISSTRSTLASGKLAKTGSTSTSSSTKPSSVTARPSVGMEKSSSFSRSRNVRSPGLDSSSTISDRELSLAATSRGNEQRRMPTQPNRSPSSTNLPPRLIPELQALAATSTKLPGPATSSVSTVSSPSTRYTDSSSPWNSSTITTSTTPTSWSSASPGIALSAGVGMPGKRSHTVPVPAMQRTMPFQLPMLDETDSGPAARAGSRENSEQGRDQSTEYRGRKKSLSASPAPTPPPRTSSVKRSRSKKEKDEDDERLQAENRPSLPASTTANTFDAIFQSPLQRLERCPPPLSAQTMEPVHNRLQESLASPVSEGRRERVLPPGLETHTMSSQQSAASTSQRKKLLKSPVEDVPSSRPTHSRKASSAPSKASVTPQSPHLTQESPSKLSKLSRLARFARSLGGTQSSGDKTSRSTNRKGPAAGTGHEGYGKYAKPGRKISSESSKLTSDTEKSASSRIRTPTIPQDRKLSTSSSRYNRSSQSDLDDFVASRMRPVVMIGGSQSSLLDPSTVPGLPSTRELIVKHAHSASASSNEGSREQRTKGKQRENFPSGDESTSPNRLVLRRSQKFGPGIGQSRAPMPPALISTKDTGSTNKTPAREAQAVADPNMYRVDPKLLKKPEKKSTGFKWNFFKRKEVVPTPTTRALLPPVQQNPEVAYSYPTAPAPRAQPYYTVMESESEGTANSDGLAEILAQVNQSRRQSAEVPIMFSPDIPEYDDQKDTPEFIKPRVLSTLLPSFPDMPPQSSQPNRPTASPQVSIAIGRAGPVQPIPQPTVATNPPKEQATARTPKAEQPSSLPRPPEPRQPRLVQVGRIPAVVSRSTVQQKPKRTSFSRPIPPNEVPIRPSVTQQQNKTVTPERPPLEIHTDVLPTRPFRQPDSGKPISAPAVSISEANERMTIPRRDAAKLFSQHSSSLSSSSSSSGPISVMGPPLLPAGLAITGATIDDEQGEEDTWREYDDFLDHVMSPSKKSQSKGKERALAVPDVTASRVVSPALSSPVVPQLKKNFREPTLPVTSTPPVIFPSPLLLSDHNVGEDIRLRRSRIVSALHSSMDPSSPFSVRDFLSEYGEISRETSKDFERLSGSSAGKSRTVTPGMSVAPPVVVSEPGHTQQENAVILDTVERNKDPEAQSELHYASLMVSKWLSFGRVLVSPAHEEVQTLPERHILVIDGLGNEDWSIYCAVTYEAEKSFVHDLKEKRKPSSTQNVRYSSHAPLNHRRTEMASFGDPFPFPPAFFSAIVLRFPPAMPEAKMNNTLSECRRCLVPGGYIELMILELEIVNMGTHTRRAVRDLKSRMMSHTPGINLKPVIDNTQTLLGQKGFINLSRRLVGVPVAGKMTGSTDSSSSSSRSSRGSDPLRRVSADTQSGVSSSKSAGHSFRRHGKNVSLNDLVTDQSENADATIGRVVSKTARSWWQHCYEAEVISDGNLRKSIFSDKKVVAECKQRASSFKLLIAHAQKPMFETRRRTMSEPVVPTLATAGGARSFGMGPNMRR